MSSFKPAVRRRKKLRMAIAGAAGSGKTYTALALARGLAGEDGQIAVIDTEHSSGELYAHHWDYLHANLDAPYTPYKYIELIAEAEEAGYDVIVIDSLSHAWAGTGGVLEIVDAAAVNYRGNTRYAWRDGTPVHNKLVEAILACKAHVIVTLRTKYEYIETTRGGKKTYEKVGTKPIQRDELDYEFDVFAEIDRRHNLRIEKSRIGIDGLVVAQPDEKLAELITTALAGDVDLEPAGVAAALQSVDRSVGETVQAAAAAASSVAAATGDANRAQQAQQAQQAKPAKQAKQAQQPKLPPKPTDPEATAREAPNVTRWAIGAYYTKRNDLFFDGPDAVINWLNWVTEGDAFEPAWSGLYLQAVNDYVRMMADGVPKKQAAELARAALEDLIDDWVAHRDDEVRQAEEAAANRSPNELDQVLDEIGEDDEEE